MLRRLLTLQGVMQQLTVGCHSSSLLCGGFIQL